MNDAKRCPVCGGLLKTGRGGGLCARCLLAAALNVPASGPPRSSTAGNEQIGPYRILRLLGEGGMGQVYLAEQQEPIARQVAVKVIKWGMDTGAVLARFESEQQALALMDHPNIAQVYEAGSSVQGRPYFAMEYVPGLPITEYCDRHRLNTRRRLELFVKVVNAVQHAHQKGVIHRDLKPGNVLVMESDGEAVPKIIDFGLAKATEQHQAQETLFTEAGVMVGTPEYMSPEQASGDRDIDTRTDIYSLGVLLYELLVGAVPFDSKTLRAAGYDEIRRVIRETDPPRPAARFDSLGEGTVAIASCRATDARGLRRELAGDLEWITLKALEKDRSRRYISAADLAGDIWRRLDGQPVLAAPPDAVYRLRRYAGRHRLQLVAAGMVLLALLAGLALSAAYYLRSEYEREALEHRNYVANLAAADRLLALNQSVAARDLLLACTPAMRNWEWWHLWSRSGSTAGVGLWQYREPIAAMAVAARSDRVALGFETGLVVVVKPDGTVDQTWQAHPNAIRAIALAPDGKQLATSGGEPEVRLWDVAANRLIARLALDKPAVSVAYGPAGRRLAAASADGTMSLWSVDSRNRLLTIHGRPPVTSMDFIPDASGLWTSGRGALDLWFLPGGEARRSFPEAGVAAFNRDGEVALTAAPGTSEARVWNARDGALWGVLPTGAVVVSAAFSARGNRVMVATRGDQLQIWDWVYFEHALTFPIEPGLRSIVFNGTGDRLLGLYPRAVRIWDTHTPQPPPAASSRAVTGGAPPVWSLFREMLAGGLFVLLMGALLGAALFRWRELQRAIDNLLARIPARCIPLRAARYGRWVARIFGSLLALLFAAMEIGEGMHVPTGADMHYAVVFVGFWLMVAGLLLAWIWEAWGGVIAIGGYALFAAMTPQMARNFFFLAMAVISLLHVLCRLRLRVAGAR